MALLLANITPVHRGYVQPVKTFAQKRVLTVISGLELADLSMGPVEVHRFGRDDLDPTVHGRSSPVVFSVEKIATEI